MVSNWTKLDDRRKTKILSDFEQPKFEVLIFVEKFKGLLTGKQVQESPLPIIYQNGLKNITGRKAVLG